MNQDILVSSFADVVYHNILQDELEFKLILSGKKLKLIKNYFLH